MIGRHAVSGGVDGVLLQERHTAERGGAQKRATWSIGVFVGLMTCHNISEHHLGGAVGPI